MRASCSVGLTLLSSWCLLSCSLTVDPVTTQCDSQRDCLELAGEGLEARCVAGYCKLVSAAEQQWGCVDDDAWEPISGIVTYQAQIVDQAAQLAESLEIRVCLDTDLACDKPLSGPFAPTVAGRIQVDLERGFTGYLDVRATNFMPLLIDFASPLVDDQALVADSWTLRGPSELPALLPEGSPADSGHLIATVVDCKSQPAAGFKVVVDPVELSSVPFYMVNGTPSPQLTATQASGVAGVAGLAQGFVTIDVSSTRDSVAFPARGAVIRKNTLTYLSLRPH